MLEHIRDWSSKLHLQRELQLVRIATQAVSHLEDRSMSMRVVIVAALCLNQSIQTTLTATARFILDHYASTHLTESQAEALELGAVDINLRESQAHAMEEHLQVAMRMAIRPTTITVQVDVAIPRVLSHVVLEVINAP